MKKNIILSGVGGQGILTIAVLLVQTAVKEGLNFKQSEVHGMAQRGGAVESHVRLSVGPIYSDIIAKGTADLIISVEPLEALRHAVFLAPGGIIITNIAPHKNIPDYPATEEIFARLRATGKKVVCVDAAAVAAEAGNPRTQNIVMAGAAAACSGMKPESFRAAIGDMFAAKGDPVVEVNLKAFELGALRGASL